jgi:hypothetical protein
MTEHKENDRKHDEKHPTKATTSEPQEEFTEIPSRPSVPEPLAKSGVRGEREHIPPVQE